MAQEINVKKGSEVVAKFPKGVQSLPYDDTGAINMIPANKTYKVSHIHSCERNGITNIKLYNVHGFFPADQFDLVPI